MCRILPPSRTERLFSFNLSSQSQPQKLIVITKEWEEKREKIGGREAEEGYDKLHTVSSGRQSTVAVMPAAAPATNLSKFVVFSCPDNLSSCFLYVS